ncbi:unnamed protein product [Phytophthora lilii]|uniref:Unnamed protein product n=1 Tax=Phytophthora lilii TaxID=2077276 RepID=A0A9W6XF69_9STRA|nr:unnamed protein product [Phytophthora lilii]
MESHLYDGIEATDFYDKLENVLSSQASAFKVNIALGYELVSKTDPDDTRYFYPNLANTYVFNKPVAINTKADIRKKVISEIRSMELADKLNYPSSGYKLKVITAFKIFVYHRDHALGDSEAVIPKVIRENKHVINFPKTNNKCVFHCIAWQTFQSTKKDPRRIQAQVKDAFKRYCYLKGIKYTLSRFRSVKPIDLLQLDEVEDCFQLGINVYSMDVATGNVESIRRSNKGYEAMDILSHENHALYIKNIDMLQSNLGFGKQRSDYGKLKQQVDQVPVFGFNSGRNDINLIMKDLVAVIGTDNIKSVIKNPSYMCIATSDMKMLDITNYVPAGTSYDKYLTTYLGSCKCDDKTRCVCGLGKGLFPYEYITAFNVLNQTTIPPIQLLIASSLEQASPEMTTNE